MANRFERLIAALTAAALVPVWLFRYVPTQDGPSHLYNAFVLARLTNPASTTLRDYFVINARPFPNWTTYLLMAPLTRVLPPLNVQQIVITICIVAIPLAVVILQRSFKGEVDAMAFLGVLLAYNALLFLGFFNFVIGAALFLITVAMWWRSGNLAIVYALLIVTYFTHAMPFAAAVLAIVILDLLQKRWRVLLEMSPALLVLAFDALHRVGATREYRSAWWHLMNLVDLNPLVYFRPDIHAWIARAALALIVVSLIAKRRHPMIAVTLALFLGYCISPWGYGAGGWSLGGWINDRFLFLALLTLPAWVTVPKKFAYAFVALIAIHFSVTAIEIARFHQRMLWVEQAAAFIRPHATLYRLGGSGHTLHVASYLALEEDVANLDNYEAHLPDFPVVFRADAPKRAPDFLLVWRDAHVRNVAGYRILFTSDDIRLYARAGP